MKHLLFLILAVTALAGPVTVGTLTMRDLGNGRMSPVLHNNTNVQIGSDLTGINLQYSITVGGNTTTASYYFDGINGVQPGADLVFPVQISPSSATWSMTILSAAFKPPLTGSFLGFPVYFGVTSYFVNGQWYVANNTAITGSASSANPIGIMQNVDSIPGWEAPSGTGGILPGPPAGQAQALGEIPEPSTWAMLMIGFAGVGVWKRSTSSKQT